jgi:hypothetical protein
MAAVEDVADPVTGPLAEALARGRDVYNARAVAAKLSPEGDGPAVTATLRGLEGVVRAAHARDPAVVDTVVSALFDAALELVPTGVLGPGARVPEVDAAWRGLLEACPRMLCADPRRVVAATLNAVTRLTACRGARPRDWVASMAALSERATDVDRWLKAGTVAAWRSGLAYAREGALDVAATLPPELAALAIGVEPTTDAPTMARVIERLRADPWAWPPHVVSGEQPPRGIKLVAYVGGFRGFGTGGQLIAPPTVGLRDGVFLVSDGERLFELHADFFGAALLPVGPAPPGFEPPPGRGAIVLEEGGVARQGDDRRQLAGLAEVTSWASTDLTFVAARPTSHLISVLAYSGYGR